MSSTAKPGPRTPAAVSCGKLRKAFYSAFAEGWQYSVNNITRWRVAHAVPLSPVSPKEVSTDRGGCERIERPGLRVHAGADPAKCRGAF